MNLATQSTTLARTTKGASIVAGLILIVILAAAMAVASVRTTSAEVATQEPAAVTSSWLVDPDYLRFRRAENGERSIHGTDWPPRPVIVPRK